MRKLLNTIYVTQENCYLGLNGENLLCLMENEEKFRIPLANVESVVCFNYTGCSPALMGKCVENKISIAFISPNGKFLAKIVGETKGNALLRVQQIDCFRAKGLMLAKNTIAAKLAGCVSLLKRSIHDIPALRSDGEIGAAISGIKADAESVFSAESIQEVMAIEGSAARKYFGVFNKAFTCENVNFSQRSRRPPLDMPNAVMSFLYTIYTNEFASALETVGLDSYIGFLHSLRSGRSSLACDMVEEVRCIVDRFTITLFNLRILTEDDFESQASGAIYLNQDGRKKVLTKWQEKKRTDMVHPYIGEKIQFGLLPYVQSNLLAKFIRGEIEEYPAYISR